MNKKQLIVGWVFLVILFSGCASTSLSGSFGGGKPDVSATIDIPLSKKGDIIQIGMTKQDLAKAGYTDPIRQGYCSECGEEWLTYDNHRTQKPEDTITFYFKDGKVKGWEASDGN